MVQYTDPDGLVTPVRNPGVAASGNGLLYTAVYNILLCRKDLDTAADRRRFAETVRSCYAKGKDGALIRGLLHRSPHKTEELEADDDYIGVCAAAHALGCLDIATEILSYGLGSGPLFLSFVYNNLDPGRFTARAWLGRKGQFVAHLFHCAGHRASWPYPAWWRYVVKSHLSAPEDDHQAMLLTWLLVEASPKSERDTADRWWQEWNKRLVYPIKHALGMHLGHTHPLAQHCDF